MRTSGRFQAALAAALLCAVTGLGAEESTVRFVNLGVREGLANASVSSLAQDAAGFVTVSVGAAVLWS